MSTVEDMTIVVFGASGYQGKLVTAELVRRGLPARLVGRDAARLSQAAPGAEHRVADAGDHDAMVRAFRGASVVLNCAGPFSRTGEAVIRAAVEAGCHYVDTAGEQPYVAAVFANAAVFEKPDTSVTVVPAANDACLPVDLLAHLVARDGDTLAVTHVLEGGGGPSRGTLRSLGAVVDAIRSGGLVYADGGWRQGDAGRSATVAGRAVVGFPLTEILTIPRHTGVAALEGFAERELATRLRTPVPEEAIAALPEGPSPQGRGTQRFTYLITRGDAVVGTVSGPDTYGITAVIAVEAARLLAAGTAPRGVRAPAEVFEPVSFLRYLQGHGVEVSPALPSSP